MKNRRKNKRENRIKTEERKKNKYRTEKEDAEGK
jgi:hypothetical protein